MTGTRWTGCVAALLAVTCWTAPGAAQRMEAAPPELEEVGVVERLGEAVPLDIPFVESTSRKVKFGDFFDGTRPVLLTLNYSNCPMLCSLQLDGLIDGLSRMRWDMGENFQMVTVSIDPTETPSRAQLTKQKYLKLYGRPGGAGGWHLLTSDREEDILKLADAVGFHYTYVPDTGEYAHAAAAIVLTPDGRLSRYLYGVEYDPQTIRLSLVEAGEGKIGSPMDQILLFCFHYDATKGKYAPAAVAAMRVAAVLTIVGLAGMVLIFWRRGKSSLSAQSDERRETQVTEAS